MTKEQKKEYYLRFSRFQQSREKAYAPLIHAAIKQQIKQYLHNHKMKDVSAEPIHRVLMHIYKDAALNYGKVVRREVKKSIGINERLIELINEYFGMDILNTSEGITETTRKVIQQVLEDATVEGLGFDDIVAKLNDTELSAARARLIARTETVTAANRGAHIAAKETGLTMNKEWLSAIDNRTREHHLEMNGRVIGMDEYFDFGDGIALLVPGDRGGTDGRLQTPASEVCNCRCTTLYIPIAGAVAKQEPKIINNVEDALQAMISFKTTQAEKDSVYEYTNSKYKTINEFYRGVGKPLDEFDVETVKQLDSLADRAPKIKIESYRGVKTSYDSIFNEYKKLKVGDVFIDKGFMSTTYKQNIATSFGNGDYEIDITIKGKNGVLIETLSTYGNEKEILFGRGSKFKVEAIREEPGSGFVLGKIILTLVEI